MRGRRGSGMVSVLVGLTLAAFGAGPTLAVTASPVAIATATLHDANGAAIGRAMFVEGGPAGVQVVVVAMGQAPGVHGLHVHAVGSCVAPSFASAGAHFNPTNASHGAHAGDLPDLVVGANGLGVLHATTTGFSLAAGPLSLFDADGAALIVHQNPDDHVTNPSGNSGARIACGEINRIV